jgi:peptide/nickel transport system permease protein
VSVATATAVRRRYPIGPLRAPRLRGVALAFLIVLLVTAVFAPLLTPQSPDTLNLASSLSGPSSGHLLGLDGTGRDIFSRLIAGTRTSLGGPALVVAFSTVVGLPLGLLTGYFGGVLDGVLARVWDVMLAFPSLLLAILIVAAFGKGFWTAGVAVGLTYIPFVARIVRGMTLAEREKPYVAALRLQGLGPLAIIRGHLLRNIWPGVASQVAVNFGYALLDLAALSFIGLGVQPPTPDWGVMLAEAKSTLLIAGNPVIWPALAVVLTVIAVNIVGEGISERVTGRS